MGKVKISRKELKKDELREFGAGVYETYERYRKAIWITLGVIIILWASAKVIGGYNTRRAIDSDNQLVEAMDEFNTGMYAVSGPDRTNALGTAVNLCEAIQAKYPGSKAARQALLLKGNALLYLDQYETAIEQFKEYRHSSNDPQEQAAACIALGYCYENRYFSSGMLEGEYAVLARDYYETAQDYAGDSYLRRQAMLGEARIYEFLGSLDSAVSLYDQILAEESRKDDLEQGRYGEHIEKEGSLRSFLPRAGDLFDSWKVAQVQKERDQILIEAREAKAAAERSVPEPAGAPAQTGEDDSLSSQTAVEITPVSQPDIIPPAEPAEDAE
jgi:tetratricopeptide (TPR) repeat protein